MDNPPMLGLHNLGDEVSRAAPQRRDVSVEILRFVSAVITLVVAVIGVATRFPAFSKPWTWNLLIALALLFLLWLSKPRLMAWWVARKERKQEQQFVKTCDAQLRELVPRFGQFIADNSNQSFLYLLQSGHPHITGLDEIFTTDFIRSWFYSYRDQLAYPTTDLHRFLSLCREFGVLVQQFGSHYVLKTEKRLAAGAAHVDEEGIGHLEAFREEYNDFLRAMDHWSKAINTCLQSTGITSHPDLWRLAPTTCFEKPKSFGKKQPALK